MSIKLMSQVWELQLDHPQQSILLCLCDFANDEGGNVRPSVARIAWKTGYGIRQVQNILSGLRKDNVVVLVQEATRHSPREYRIDLSVIPRKEAFAVYKARQAEESARGANITPLALGVQNGTSRGAITVAPNSSEVLLPTVVIQPSSNNNISPHAEKEPTPAQPQYTARFEAFWFDYGRKGNKHAAFKRWQQHKCEAIYLEVEAGLVRYLASARVHAGYKQDAEHWLRDRGWESEWVEEVVPNGQAATPTGPQGGAPLVPQPQWALDRNEVAYWRKDGAAAYVPSDQFVSIRRNPLTGEMM